MRLASRWIYLSCAAALAIYASPLLCGEWEFLTLWDDRENFVENDAIQHGLSWHSVNEMFTMTKLNVYEPLGWMLKAVVVQIAGLDPWTVRVVSVLLHFAAGFVLAQVSAILLDMVSMLSRFQLEGLRNEQLEKKERKRHWYGCCLSTVLFLVHPVNVEVVAWPSAQPYTLCALFSNLALYMYVKDMYQTLDRISSENIATKELFSSVFKESARRDLVCCGLYIGALLSKSASILLPASFVLLDVLVFISLRKYFPRITARGCWPYIAGKIPTTMVLLTFLTITLTSNRYGAHMDADVLSLSLNERLLKAFTTPAWILQHYTWPAKLRPHYQLQDGELSIENAEYQLLIVASIAFLLLILWFVEQRQPQHFLALLNATIMLLPVSGIVQHGMVSAGCDRYAYLSATIFVPYGGTVFSRWMLSESEREIEPEHEHSPRRTTQAQPQTKQGKSVAVSVVALLLGVLLFISTGLLTHWRNEISLLEYSLRMDPSDWRIIDQYAATLLRLDRCGQDNKECHRLWELSYHFTPKGTLKSDLHRMKVLVLLGNLDGACEVYMKLVKYHPQNCHVHNNAGVCWVHHNQLDKAREEFQRALQTRGYENLHSTPKQNLEKLEEWIAVQEEMSSRRAQEDVPPFTGDLMF